MLLVKTKVAVSNIPNAGLGLYAAEFIPKGKVIWKENPLIDKHFSSLEELNLSSDAKFQIEKYSWYDKNRNIFILAGDDTRFFNHSNNPNCDDSPLYETIALTDIPPNTELTVDYATFHHGKWW